MKRKGLSLLSAVISGGLICLFVVLGLPNSAFAGKIVFSSDRGGNSDIWSIEDNGINLRQLTDDSAKDYAPQWSPDGTKIAYCKFSSDQWNGDLYIMNWDGSGSVKIVSGIACGSSIRWSADGQYIFYGKAPAQCSAKIYRSKTDGSNEILFLDPAIVQKAEVWDYDFSPDGSEIVFHAQNGCNSNTFELYIVDSDGVSDVTTLHSDGSNYEDFPVWTSDGTAVVWRLTDGSGSNIHIINADGTGDTKLTTVSLSGREYYPLDRMSDSKILYTTNDNAGNNFQMWKMNEDGLGAVQLTNEGNSIWADWMPIPYILKIVKSGNGTGTVTSTPEGIDCGGDCQAAFDKGTVVTIKAVPDVHNRISSLSGCQNVSADKTQCTVTMTSTKTVKATFVVDPHLQLSVTKSGKGTGTVTSDLPGISCGSDCKESYWKNETVVLTAVADDGSIFSGWGGACTGTQSTCAVTMSSAKSAKATFLTNKLTVKLPKYGKVTGDGITCGSGGTDCTENITPATTSEIVTLKAVPDAGYGVKSWSGCDAGSGGTTDTCQVTMDKAKTVSVTFLAYKLTVKNMGPGVGTVTSDPSGITCGGDCLENYPANTVVTLTAEPAEGYALVSWKGCTSSSGNTCTVTMSSNKTVTATFAPSLYGVWYVSGNETTRISITGYGSDTATEPAYNEFTFYKNGTFEMIGAQGTWTQDGNGFAVYLPTTAIENEYEAMLEYYLEYFLGIFVNVELSNTKITFTGKHNWTNNTISGKLTLTTKLSLPDFNASGSLSDSYTFTGIKSQSFKGVSTLKSSTIKASSVARKIAESIKAKIKP